MVLGILHKLIVGPPFSRCPQICVQCQEPAANPIRARCQHVFDQACFQEGLQNNLPCSICFHQLEMLNTEETERSCFFCINRLYSIFTRVLDETDSIRYW